MTDEKIPYLQCLYHTGKKVYKYWLLGLSAIAIVVAIGLIIANAWKQICDVANYIGSCIGIIYNTILTMICSISWYWWVAIGVTIGPMVLVAIYCALKRYNVTLEGSINVVWISLLCIISVVTACYLIYILCKLSKIAPSLSLTGIEIIYSIISFVWWFILIFWMCDIE